MEQLNTEQKRKYLALRGNNLHGLSIEDFHLLATRGLVNNNEYGNFLEWNKDLPTDKRLELLDCWYRQMCPYEEKNTEIIIDYMVSMVVDSTYIHSKLLEANELAKMHFKALVTCSSDMSHKKNVYDQRKKIFVKGVETLLIMDLNENNRLEVTELAIALYQSRLNNRGKHVKQLQEFIFKSIDLLEISDSLECLFSLLTEEKKEFIQVVTSKIDEKLQVDNTIRLEKSWEQYEDHQLDDTYRVFFISHVGTALSKSTLEVRRIYFERMIGDSDICFNEIEAYLKIRKTFPQFCTDFINESLLPEVRESKAKELLEITLKMEGSHDMLIENAIYTEYLKIIPLVQDVISEQYKIYHDLFVNAIARCDGLENIAKTLIEKATSLFEKSNESDDVMFISYPLVGLIEQSNEISMFDLDAGKSYLELLLKLFKQQGTDEYIEEIKEVKEHLIGTNIFGLYRAFLLEQSDEFLEEL